jgi:hypothetical protein
MSLRVNCSGMEEVEERKVAPCLSRKKRIKYKFMQLLTYVKKPISIFFAGTGG